MGLRFFSKYLSSAAFCSALSLLRFLVLSVTAARADALRLMPDAPLLLSVRSRPLRGLLVLLAGESVGQSPPLGEREPSDANESLTDVEGSDW